MSAMAPELMVASLAIGGELANPGDTVAVAARFTLSLPNPSVRLECEWPSGDLRIRVPKPLPVAASGGVLRLLFEHPFTLHQESTGSLLELPPMPESWWLKNSVLLGLNVPADASGVSERWLSGSLALPPDSIAFGHPLLAEDIFRGPDTKESWHIELSIDTHSGVALSPPDQPMPLQIRNELRRPQHADVQIQLSFEPAISLLYARIPGPSTRRDLPDPFDLGEGLS